MNLWRQNKSSKTSRKFFKKCVQQAAQKPLIFMSILPLHVTVVHTELNQVYRLFAESLLRPPLRHGQSALRWSQFSDKPTS